MKLGQIHDGEWVSPIRRGYKLCCCRCGLTHSMDFRVKDGVIQFRAKRIKKK